MAVSTIEQRKITKGDRRQERKRRKSIGNLFYFFIFLPMEGICSLISLSHCPVRQIVPPKLTYQLS